MRMQRQTGESVTLPEASQPSTMYVGVAAASKCNLGEMGGEIGQTRDQCPALGVFGESLRCG